MYPQRKRNIEMGERMHSAHSDRFLELVKDSLTRVEEIEVETVKRALEQGPSFSLLDVREKEEWATSHIAQAVHLSKGVIERDIENAYPDKNAQLVLYCGGGFRSALACDNLQKMGYKNVLSMKGGIKAWQRAGYALNTQE